MKDIAETLFNGDYWAANHFQNKFIGDAVLEILPDATIQLINWTI